MGRAYGRLPHTRDRRDYLARPAAVYTGAYVNLESDFPEPWDQRQLGACVSFGASAALVFARAKMGLPPLNPSELFAYWAARQRAGYDVREDTGLEIRDGFASLAADGVPPAALWPYDPTRFAVRPPAAAWEAAALDEAIVYGAVGLTYVDDVIAGGYPVVIGFDVYESFELQRTTDTGVMPIPALDERVLGGHCVVLVSTPRDGALIPGAVPGVRYRRARNSWGTDWGDGGWFWFPVPAMVYASDFWQVTTVSAPTPPVPPSPAPDPRSVDDADRALADVARDGDWVDNRHVGGNRRMAQALKRWLTVRGL